MGLRERQILTGIELPLASSIIVGGFRTATLQVIATATIGAILGGRRARPVHRRRASTRATRPRVDLAGVILVAALAIGVDLVLVAASRRG